MKKLLFLSVAIVYTFCFSRCNTPDSKPDGNDSPKIKNTSTNKPDTIGTKKLKHLAFLDARVLNKIRDSSSFYSYFLARFDPVPKSDFEKYFGNFNTFFQIPGANPQIRNFNPPTFSIYNKYNDFQHDLSLQDIGFTDITTDIKFKNKIRIYPAIEPVTKFFYLVLMGETKDTSSISDPLPETDISIFYSIKDDVFDMVPRLNRTEAIRDIKNFQAIWKDLGNTNPGFTFFENKSFSYSIGEYNELLSATFPFWDVASSKTDQASTMIVKIFPVINADNPSKVVFMLVFKLFDKATGNEVPSKGYFDNMDPCPDECPKLTTEIQ